MRKSNIAGIAFSLYLIGSGFTPIKPDALFGGIQPGFYFSNPIPKKDLPERSEEDKPRMYAVSRRNPEEEILEQIEAGNPNKKRKDPKEGHTNEIDYIDRRPHRLGLR